MRNSILACEKRSSSAIEFSCLGEAAFEVVATSCPFHRLPTSTGVRWSEKYRAPCLRSIG